MVLLPGLCFLFDYGEGATEKLVSARIWLNTFGDIALETPAYS